MANPLLALKLKELRLQHNYTQKYVSYYLNMSRGGYAQYEIDARTPSIEMLLKLSQLYGVGVDTFINPEIIPISNTHTKSDLNCVNEDKNFSSIKIDINQLKIIGNLFLHANPTFHLEDLTQEDIDFLSLYKSLSEDTKQDIRLFCAIKKKASDKQ